MTAAALGDLAAMKAAVEKGASVDSADANGWNALTISVALGHGDCVKWLLANKANPNTQTKLGQSPLDFAAMRDETDWVDRFVAAGAKPGPGSLNHAIINKNRHIFDALIKAGANPKEGSVCLCIEYGQAAMAAYLLDKGANPESGHFNQMKNNVYWAVAYDQPEILRMVLERGANPLAKGASGITPFDLSRMLRRDDLVPILNPYIKKAEAAESFAADLANKEAKKNFGVEPFDRAQGNLDIHDGRWQWHAVAGYGKGDLDATVSFTVNESDPKAEVKQIVSAPDQQAF